MFDFVAKHKRIIQIVVALLAVPFMFFGLESYTRSVGGANDVATVEGAGISQREFGEALRQQQDRLRAAFGRSVDAAAFDTPEMRLSVLDALIVERLVTGEVANARLILGKEAIIAEIMKAPDFQENHKFSPERYSAYLRARGLTDETNVALLRVQLPAARLISSLADGAIQARTVAGRLLALEGQRREVSDALIAAEPYLAQLKPDEAQLRAYFDSRAAEFRVPERVRAEYVTLSAEDLGRGEAATEDEIKGAYQARASQLAVSEQRRASHILVKSKGEAEKLLVEARNAPERFAALAKAHSQDSGSAERGGDVGFFGPGDVVKPFAEAAFGMKEGEIAGPVESEFGFHVIRLAAIQPGKVRPLEELRAELGAAIAKQKGAKKFAEAAEAFSNMVYEQSDSLAPAAERFKLKPQTSGWIARGAAAQSGPFANPKLLAAIFSSDAIQQRRNTDAVEVAPGVLVAARIAEHQSATQRKFDEARAEVEQKFKQLEAGRLTRQEGAAKLERLVKGGHAEVRWGAAKVVSRRDPQGLPVADLRRVMSADASELPAYVGLERGPQGYALYRISKVLPPDSIPDAQKAEDMQRLERQAGAEQREAYFASLRARAKVEINRANLEKK